MDGLEAPATYKDMIHLACTSEVAFLDLVRAESEKIPLSVRIFLADRIRNALMCMGDNEHAGVIENALEVVGI